MYMSVLSSLSVDEKLDLIAKLTNSIRNTYTKEQDIETEDPFALRRRLGRKYVG